MRGHSDYADKIFLFNRAGAGIKLGDVHTYFAKWLLRVRHRYVESEGKVSDTAIEDWAHEYMLGREQPYVALSHPAFRTNVHDF